MIILQDEIYGSKPSDFVILEGVMNRDWYKPLFELAVQLYDTEVYAYYFDLTFEETLRRHLVSNNDATCIEDGTETAKGDNCDAADTRTVADSGSNTASPRTGDNSNTVLWIIGMLAASAALTGTILYSRKRKYHL